MPAPITTHFASLGACSSSAIFFPFPFFVSTALHHYKARRISASNPSMCLLITVAARSASPSLIASRISRCSSTAWCRWVTFVRPRNQMRSAVRVVTVEIVRQIRVMAGAVDHVVNALVEFHQRRTMLLQAA